MRKKKHGTGSLTSTGNLSYIMGMRKIKQICDVWGKKSQEFIDVR